MPQQVTMNQPTHTSGRRLFTYLIVGSLLATCLPRTMTDRLDHLLGAVLAPFSDTGRSMSLAVTNNMRHFALPDVPGSEYAELKEAYLRTETRCLNLTEELCQQRELNAQLSGLRQLAGLRAADLIQAQVVGSDSTIGRQIKTVNRGARHHVAPEQIVLAPCRSAEGHPSDSVEQDEAPDTYQMALVGRIAATGQWTSKLQLINDPEFRLAVQIVPAADRGESWRARGMLNGTVSGETTVLVAREHAVREGDLVLARADPRDLPVSMLIGTVSECRSDDATPVMLQVTVEPAVNLATIRDIVAIVIKRDG